MESKTSVNHWWAMLIRGIVAIILGLMAFIWTGLTLELLLILLGIYFLLDGLFSIWGSILTANFYKNWWLLLIEGIVSLIIVISIFTYPAITLIVLVYLIAIWAIITGVFELWASFAAPWAAIGKTFLGLTGVFSLILGILIIAYPVISLIVVVWIFGAYALLTGLSLIIFSFKLKSGALAKKEEK